MMKKKTPAGTSIDLPSDACPVCSSPTKEKRGKLAFPVNGEDIRVRQAAHLACPRVTTRSFVPTTPAVCVSKRSTSTGKHGLLRADDIRSLRERFGLTQAELARLLRYARAIAARQSDLHTVISARGLVRRHI